MICAQETISEIQFLRPSEYVHSTQSVSANCSSTLGVLWPGASKVMVSSAPQRWHGLLIEKYLAQPEHCESACVDTHMLMLTAARPAQFEYRTLTGRWQASTIRSDIATAVPAGIVPERRLHASTEVVYCCLAPNFVTAVETELDVAPARRLSFGDALRDTSIACIMRLLLNLLENSTVPDRLYAESLGHALALRYVLAESSQRATGRSACSPLPPRLLSRVRAKIEAHLDCDLSLSELAEVSGYSRAHFLRMFRTATGMTPHQYVLELRLARAKEHLRQKELTVTDIASTCGFSSQSHMTSAFRKYLEVTPAEYRRNI